MEEERVGGVVVVVVIVVVCVRGGKGGGGHVNEVRQIIIESEAVQKLQTASKHATRGVRTRATWHWRRAGELETQSSSGGAPKHTPCIGVIDRAAEPVVLPCPSPEASASPRDVALLRTEESLAAGRGRGSGVVTAGGGCGVVLLGPVLEAGRVEEAAGSMVTSAPPPAAGGVVVFAAASTPGCTDKGAYDTTSWYGAACTLVAGNVRFVCTGKDAAAMGCPMTLDAAW